MGAVHRLRIASWVPVAVVKDDGVGTGEVDALATRLCRQEKGKNFVVCNTTRVKRKRVSTSPRYNDPATHVLSAP